MSTGQEHGPQPLDALMNELKLTNADLVRASDNQLTHKAVQKGRRGRELAVNSQHKILRAIQSVRPEKPLTLKDLFTY